MSDTYHLDAARRGLRGSLALEPTLEAEYDRRLDRPARRQIVLVLSAILVLTTLGLPADANAGILLQALVWKLVLQAPFVLLGLWAVRHARLPADKVWLAGAIPMFMSVVTVSIIATETVAPLIDRFATIAGLTTFGANVALPLKFRQSLAMTLANVAVFVAIPVAVLPFDAVAPFLDILLFMSAIALATTALAHSRERSQKRAFLLSLTTEQQTQELQDLVEKLTELAHRDPLTGAGNRRSFDMRFQAAWRAASARGETIALLLIDVDHFKLFNDAAGHPEGDACLKAVARAIAAGANCSIEAVSRYGGEEFALILPAAPKPAADDIRASVEALAMPHPGRPKGSIVTVSIGCAMVRPGEGAERPEDLVQAADEALYEAKRGGRNRAVLAGTALRVAA